MSILGRIVENMSGGLIHEVETDEEAPPAAAEGHQTVTRSHAQSMSPASAPQTASPAGNEPAAAARAKKDLELVLGATPEKFQRFLERKLEFIDVLVSAGTAADKIEAVATDKALKAVKLTLADMNAAMTAAKDTLGGLRSDFARELNSERETQVTQPAQGVQRTEKEIQDLRAEIARLEGEIAEKEAGIQPAQIKIKEAEEDLAQGQAIFDVSCRKVEVFLQAMEKQILQSLQQK